MSSFPWLTPCRLASKAGGLQDIIWGGQRLPVTRVGACKILLVSSQWTAWLAPLTSLPQTPEARAPWGASHSDDQRATKASKVYDFIPGSAVACAAPMALWVSRKGKDLAPGI